MLFAPASDARKVAKVFGCGADAVILDLEDAVAVAEKPAARSAAVAAMQTPRPCRGYVRVNGLTTPFAYEDFEIVVAGGIDGIVVPKIESAGELSTAEWLLGAIEAKRGLPVGAIDLLPIIETGKGVAAAQSIAAAARRTRRLCFGAGDYAADMGLEWSRNEAEMAHARAEIALASRAADMSAPIDTVWVRLGDTEGLIASAETVRSMGYTGKLCIHPEQVTAVNTVFTPDADEVARARRIVDAFEEAEADGAASIQVDGAFVDYPIVERARLTLSLANFANAKS